MEQRSTWTRHPHVSYRFRLALLRVATVPLEFPAIGALESVLFRPLVGDASGEVDDAIESLDDLRAGVFASGGRALALPFVAVAVAVVFAGAVGLALDFDLVDVPKNPELLVRREEREGSGAIASSSSSCSSISVSSSPYVSVWSASSCPCSSSSSSTNEPGILCLRFSLLDVLPERVDGRLVPSVVVAVLFVLRWGLERAEGREGVSDCLLVRVLRRGD